MHRQASSRALAPPFCTTLNEMTRKSKPKPKLRFNSILEQPATPSPQAPVAPSSWASVVASRDKSASANLTGKSAIRLFKTSSLATSPAPMPSLRPANLGGLTPRFPPSSPPSPATAPLASPQEGASGSLPPQPPLDTRQEGASHSEPHVLPRRSNIRPVKQPHRESAILPSLMANDEVATLSDKTTTAHRKPPAKPRRYAEHKPFATCFADNKEIYWGRPPHSFKATLFIAVCASTAIASFSTVHRKLDNGAAALAFNSQWGVCHLGYQSTMFTDNCGSMQHVRRAQAHLGLAHEWLPPDDPQTNLVESLIGQVISVADKYMLGNPHLPDSAYPYVLHGVFWVRNRISTKRHGRLASPWSLAGIGLASMAAHVPLGTIGWARKKREEKNSFPGTPLPSAPIPRHTSRCLRVAMCGYLSMHTSIYRVVLLDFVTATGQSIFRATRHVYWNPLEPPASLIVPDPPAPKHLSSPAPHTSLASTMPAPQPIEIVEESPAPQPIEFIDDLHTPLEPAPSDSAALSPQQPETPRYSDLEPRDPSRGHYLPPERPVYDSDAAATDEEEGLPWVESYPPTSIESPGRTTLNIGYDAATADTSFRITTLDLASKSALQCVVKAAKSKRGTNSDLPWAKHLSGDRSAECIAAYNKEIQGLGSTVCTWIDEGTPEYEKCLRDGTKCRALLSIKRSGCYKARIVKQGFKEDLKNDGEFFNYYAGVVSLASIRLMVSLVNFKRRLAVIDVSHAFLQSRPYPNGQFKYMYFKDPITKRMTGARQSGPIYGENSAPRRWLETLKEFILSIGFTIIRNDESLFYLHERDLTVGAHVDDLLCLGIHQHIAWFISELRRRFKCTDPEWLLPGVPLDILGMVVLLAFCDGLWRIYFSMARYIEGMIESLEITELPPRSTPIAKPVHCECPDDAPPTCPRCPLKLRVGDIVKRWFQAACGCINWCNTTTRYDISHAYARISAYMANPTVGAVKAALYCVQYLFEHRHLCLQVILQPPTAELQWEFYTDSDQSGNRESLTSGHCPRP